MDQSSFDALPPDRLARLLDLEKAAGWSGADAAAALSHQLHAPLLPDLQAAPGADAGRYTRDEGDSTITFLQALTCASPDIEQLQDIKAWAKWVRGQTGHPLSPGPATVIYYAAIAAARRAGHAITSLPEDDLREGFLWSGQQPGAEQLTALFDEVLAL